MKSNHITTPQCGAGKPVAWIEHHKGDEMIEKRYYPSQYYPGGYWKLFLNGAFVDSWTYEWEVDAYIFKRGL